MDKRLTVSSLYNELFSSIDSFRYQNDIKSTILTKRNRANNSKEFQESMLNNINFFELTNEEYLKLIDSMFKNKEYLTDKVFTNRTTQLLSQIKRNVPNLLNNSIQFYTSKYKTENALIEGLEFDYSYRKIENEILGKLLTVLCNENNYHITKDLLYNSFEENSFEIRKYTHTYINTILKNMIFTSSQT